MNTIGEIGEQNQQDFLSLMYLYVGKEMLETCGREAERAIRRAVMLEPVEGYRLIKS